MNHLERILDMLESTSQDYTADLHVKELDGRSYVVIHPESSTRVIICFDHDDVLLYVEG